MTRPANPEGHPREDTEQVCLRIPTKWIARLEGISSRDGRNRTTMLREAIAIGLRALEKAEAE